MIWVCIVVIQDVAVAAAKSYANRSIVSAQVEPQASKRIGQHFILQQDNDPKHNPKATKFPKLKTWENIK